MRISTNTIFNSSAARISDLQVGINKTSQQLSANRRILSPSDDPIASARALVVTQAVSINDQYAINRRNGKNNLSAAENILANVTDSIQSVKTLIVSAGSGILTDTDRGYIATELQGNLDQMLALANSTDQTGSYLFSGYANTIAPYVKTAGGATYVGDQGLNFVQVDSSRQIAMSDTGPAIFGNIRTSANAFAVSGNSANTGTAVISSGTVSDATLLTGHNYEIKYASATSFDILDKTTGQAVPAAQISVSVSGNTITFDGLSVDISGPTPAAGDTFSVQPGNQNIFETLTDLINILRTPANTLSSKANLQAGLAQANNNVDKSLSNILTSRAKIGNSLKEIDTLDSAGEGAGLVYKQELSSLQDVDYVKAISDLTQQKMVLEAAQQSFVKTTSLSLFNYIS
jgi:flagellar hook-associated protein 3 FlgL